LGCRCHTSVARSSRSDRNSAAAVLAENIEAKLAMGETIDLAQHALISSTLVRLATRLGINRHAKTVTPLRDYLEAKALPTTTQTGAAP
jgi:hypothetical protein